MNKLNKIKLLINHYYQIILHKILVLKFITNFSLKLLQRGLLHDISKFYPCEANKFAESTPKLKKLTYGSIEYKKELENIGSALKHHYNYNRHHPEYFLKPTKLQISSSNSPISCMNLLDIVEMLYDWKAASKRHTNGDIRKSINLNKERFNYDNMIESLLLNTIDEV